MDDVGIVAMNGVYEAATLDAKEILLKAESDKIVAEAVGVAKMCVFNKSSSDLILFLTTIRLIENPDFKGTITDACEAVLGKAMSKRTFYRHKKDLENVLDDLKAAHSDNMAQLWGSDFNTVRLISRGISDSVAQKQGKMIKVGNDQFEFSPENYEIIKAAMDAESEGLKKQAQKKEKELKEKLEKVEKNQDKIIREKTRGLELERDNLLKDVEALKPFEEAAKKNYTLNLERIQRIEKLAIDFVAQCRPFIVDDNIKEDPVAIGKLYGVADMVERAFMGFRKQLDEAFAPEEG